MNVAVLGAAGTIGPALVRDLANSEEVAELLLLDLDVTGVPRDGGAAVRSVDARHSAALAKLLDDADILVNSASYRVNLDAMRACLGAGCHYVDLGGLYWMTDRQLELDGPFRQAGLLALLGMGSSPGKTNVMAARAVAELDEPPTRVDAAAASRDLDPPPGLSVPYALRTLIDELTMAPVEVREGVPVELKPLTPGGPVRFPEPIGEVETIHTLHSEVRTFPESFGCEECGFRLSLEPALLARLRELEDAAVETAPPSPSTVSAHVVEAESGGRVVRISALTRPIEEWGLGGGVVSTAAPAAAAVRLLARGRIEARGVLPPERCVEPGDLFPELERRACSFEIEVREEDVIDGPEARRSLQSAGLEAPRR
jgi:saccharopine dehydrogenase (NAD+, L-lysine-forming)